MAQKVYIVRGPNPNNYDWDVDADGYIFGVYATQELAERGLREAYKEYDMDFDDEDDEHYFMKEIAPWIDERVVQGSVSSANRKSIGRRSRR